ncbi:acid phosphatase [Serratia marcescens]|jgi:membrane-associated phospholipid phosphatase|uniref:Inositol phosphorylceramide synthase n=1 Tax=Serratia surfactantfaciens TaxID=2741499 RepID=A0ABS0M087_9GAMM|nr:MULTISPECIES: phosphatase PAP2 family protein [Serratia]WMW59655.1 phosphatase PAP2 family protein [Serratia marcescens]AOE99748.1 acid phosphatase [Serratia surfactantfaciens]MBH1920989.1 inositol phosphorylceramide synthase [Serratia surfactantfaciens]MTD05845.1 phosphatase PAP2 family protein [Serratia sp. YC16]BEO38070.1 acid phosphatase [Serratia marcescens]
MKNALFRLWQMLLGWGTVGIVYNLTDRLQGAGTLLPPSALDRAIPFSPSAIWLYLSFFLIVPAGYLLAPLQRIKWLTLAMQLTALGAGAVYLLWPTTMAYPQNDGVGISAQLLAALTQVDSPQNCLPSLHMALTVLAVWALSDGERKMRTALWMLWGVAIAFSILQLRRHLFVDLAGGALLALFAGWLALRMQTLRGRVVKGEMG